MSITEKKQKKGINPNILNLYSKIIWESQDIEQDLEENLLYDDESEIFSTESFLQSYFSKSIPENYEYISNRLDEIENLIKGTVVHKEDMVNAKNEIITHQKEEIEDAKRLIKELGIELQKRSISNILMWVSLAGLIISLSFLALSIFQSELIFSSFHFVLLSLTFVFVLAMTFFSKKVYR